MPANAGSPVGRSGKRAMDIVLSARSTADIAEGLDRLARYMAGR